MSLRELKQEIDQLPEVGESVDKFEKHWIKPIKRNTNKHLPFLNDLSEKHKQELNRKLANSRKLLEEIRSSQIIKGKLQTYARYLIELKLTSINQNKSKAKYITNHLLNDEFLCLTNAIADIKKFDEDVRELKSCHAEIGDYLERNLALEHALIFMELPHYKYLVNLLQTAKDHKRMVRDIGRNFVKMAKALKPK